jgi:trigger factor
MPRLERVEDVEGGVQAEVLITLWPELDEIPEYEGYTVEVESVELSEDDIAASLETMRNQFASLETVERPAADGDFVSIDLSAHDDTGPVPETVANELLYEIGSDQLVEGTDDHLRGLSAGEEATFESVLPTGFGDKAGKEVSFTIKVNEVKQKVLPEVNDEWVSEVTEFDTMSELEAELRVELAAGKRRAVARDLRQKVLDYLIDGASVEIPDQLVRMEVEELFHRFAHRLEDSGISVEDYLEVSGLSKEDLEADLRAQADRSLKTRIVLEAIAGKEGIEVKPEDLAGQIDAMARLSKNPEQVYEAMKEQSRVLSLAGDILRSKALEAVIAGVNAVDAEGNPVELGTEMAAEEMETEVEALPLEDEVVVEAEIVDEEP